MDKFDSSFLKLTSSITLVIIAVICSFCFCVSVYDLEKVKIESNAKIVINAQWAKSVEYCADAAASVFGK